LTNAPEIVGVDDFALRRSRRYGTIIVDMATGKAIDVLDTRDAEPLYLLAVRTSPGPA
jgi:transposase